MAGIGVVFGEHDIGAGATTQFYDVDVGHVRISRQYHIAGMIYNSVIGISRNVFKKLRCGFISPFGRGSLLGTNIAECHKDLVVYVTCIDQEAINLFWMKLMPASSRVSL